MTGLATRPFAAPGAAALAGLRVVEMGFAAAGPLVGKYLANFGAEVIRLERNYRSTVPILGAAAGLIANNEPARQDAAVRP